jgi:hypothetical protein
LSAESLDPSRRQGVSQLRADLQHLDADKLTEEGAKAAFTADFVSLVSAAAFIGDEVERLVCSEGLRAVV